VLYVQPACVWEVGNTINIARVHGTTNIARQARASQTRYFGQIFAHRTFLRNTSTFYSVVRLTVTLQKLTHNFVVSPLTTLCVERSFSPTHSTSFSNPYAVTLIFQARILSKQFKELSPAEKKKWDKKAEKDKSRYQDEMKTWVPDEDEEPAAGKRSKKAKKDPNMPKRNMSAYFLYSVDIRPKVKEENPDASFGDIAKIISTQYKSLSDSERKSWDDKAAADKVRYENAMEAYKASL
jgi:hypothetical protein